MQVRPLNFRDDRERFNTFCRLPGVFDAAKEDGVIVDPTQDFSLDLANPSLLYMGALFDGEVQGVFKLVKCGRALYEVHVVLLPEIRGKLGLEFAREGLKQLWTSQPEATLFSLLPACNRAALAFAAAAGFRAKGRLSASFFQKGRFFDRILVELRQCQG